MLLQNGDNLYIAAQSKTAKTSVPSKNHLLGGHLMVNRGFHPVSSVLGCRTCSNHVVSLYLFHPGVEFLPSFSRFVLRRFFFFWREGLMITSKTPPDLNRGPESGRLVNTHDRVCIYVKMLKYIYNSWNHCVSSLREIYRGRDLSFFSSKLRSSPAQFFESLKQANQCCNANDNSYKYFFSVDKETNIHEDSSFYEIG